MWASPDYSLDYLYHYQTKWVLPNNQKLNARSFWYTDWGTLVQQSKAFKHACPVRYGEIELPLREVRNNAA